MNIILIIVIVYFVLMLGVAWYFSRKENIETYFLNNKKTGLWLMVFSNVATLIGAGAVVAMVSEGYNSGISYGLASIVLSIVGMIILAIFAKRLRQYSENNNIYSIADFYEKRFGPNNKKLLTILQPILMIIWVAVQVIAISAMASFLIGINSTLAIILAVGITIIYTTLGGLKIDIISDCIQFWMILIILIAIAIFGYFQIGGLNQLVLSVPKGHLNPFAFGGLSWFIGMVLFSGFMYLGNGAHWQRILSAKNSDVAKKSYYYSIPFMIIISVIIIFLGLLAAVILSNINQDQAIYLLMYKTLPVWMVGLGFAAILAVVTSSIDSLMIGGSTIIYKQFFSTKEKNNLLYARLITVLFGIISGVIAFIIPSIIKLSLFVSYMALMFVPSVIAGFVSKKTSGKASFYSILLSVICLSGLYFFTSYSKSSFILGLLIAVITILFYDKVFKKDANKPF
jgi:solute:Na+ symporter, SSS family